MPRDAPVLARPYGVLRTLLLVFGVASIVHAFYVSMVAAMSIGIDVGPDGATMPWAVVPERFRELYRHGSTIDLIFVALLCGSAITWLRWQTLAEDDAATSGAPSDRTGAGIWWWFIPVANLWKPYQLVRSLAVRSERLNDRGASTGPVVAWWILWLGGVAAFVVARVWTTGVAELSDPISSRDLVAAALVADVLLGAAALTAVLVTGRITAALEWARLHPTRQRPGVQPVPDR